MPDALYRCYCLLNMPPETKEEEELCRRSADGCWRFKVNGQSRGWPEDRVRAFEERQRRRPPADR